MRKVSSFFIWKWRGTWNRLTRTLSFWDNSVPRQPWFVYSCLSRGSCETNLFMRRFEAIVIVEGKTWDCLNKDLRTKYLPEYTYLHTPWINTNFIFQTNKIYLTNFKNVCQANDSFLKTKIIISGAMGSFFPQVIKKTTKSEKFCIKKPGSWWSRKRFMGWSTKNIWREKISAGTVL